MDVKYNMDTKVEDNTRLYKLQKSNFDREINTAVRMDLLILCMWWMAPQFPTNYDRREDCGRIHHASAPAFVKQQ